MYKGKNVKLLAALISASMIIGSMPVSAAAAETTESEASAGTAVFAEISESTQEASEERSSGSTETASTEGTSDSAGTASTEVTLESSETASTEESSDSTETALTEGTSESTETSSTKESTDNAESSSSEGTSEESSESSEETASEESSDNTENSVSEDTAEETTEEETTEETEASTEVSTSSGSDDVEILTSSGDDSITFSSSGITADESRVTVTEKSGIIIATINESGTYQISGSGSCMAVAIKENLDVTLETGDLSIDNTMAPKAKFIETGDGCTVNIVLKGDATVEAGKNTIKAGENSVINISGDGLLTSTGTSDDAVKAKNGTVNISGGTLNITECGGDGIQAENVEITDGTLNIDTWYQGAATCYYSGSTYSEGSDTSVNYLWEESGETVKYERVNVDTGSHKGIKAGTKAKTITFADQGAADITEGASGSLKISGGNITIDTTKSGLKAGSLSTTGYTATKSGKYIIGSPDDAISCNNDMEITGGTIVISSGDDGISTMKKLSVTGDTDITVKTAYEGIEAATVVIGDGEDAPVITINSADDGINTSGKTLTYTYDTYDGYNSDDEINYTRKSVSTTTGNNMTVNSGSVTINIDSEGTKTAALPDGSLDSLKSVTFKTGGDGIDCNGGLTQNGGELYVYGQASGDNSPIDTNSGYTFNSGSKVLGTGVDGMNESSPKSGSGTYITYGAGMNGGMNGGPQDGSGEMTPGDNGGTPPEMPGNNSGNTPPGMPGNSESNTNNNTPPSLPGNNGGNGNNEEGGTPPEMPENGGGNNGKSGGENPGNGINPGNGMNSGNGFTAGQYWAVVDSDSKVVDSGELKYSGSFIVYGSDLISGGGYTLTVTDSKPEKGEIIEVNNGSLFNPESMSQNEAQDERQNETPAALSENSISSNVIKGSFTIGGYSYEYSYTDDLNYNGKKQVLSDLTINGQMAGSTLSGNIIFKKVRYKNNKAAGEGKAIPVLKASYGADSSVKKAVKAINKEFKENPLIFNISRTALDTKNISGSAIYNSSSGKWKFSLYIKNADGTTTKLKYRKNGKGDFEVEESTFNNTTDTVNITGINNYTGTATVQVTVK